MLNDANDSKFVTRKWNIVNDKFKYAAANKVNYNTEFLKSNHCDYYDAFILVKGDITVAAAHATQVAFRNCAPFTECIEKLDGTTIDDTEDLDLVMSIYNLIECSSNYSEATGSLWFYSKYEGTDFNADIVNDNNFEFFTYKANLLGSAFAQADNAANGALKIATVAVPLKYLSNFWRSLEIALLNCKVELQLKWSSYCVLSAVDNDNANDNDDNIIFTIKDTKLYVSVVTLSARDKN